MSTVTITVTLPTQRKSGAAATPADVATVTVYKGVGTNAAAVLATVTSPTTPTVDVVDSSPDAGQTDEYSATVTDANGVVSSVSNTVSVAVPAAADPLVPPTVSAVLNP